MTFLAPHANLKTLHVETDDLSPELYEGIAALKTRPNILALKGQHFFDIPDAALSRWHVGIGRIILHPLPAIPSPFDSAGLEKLELKLGLPLSRIETFLSPQKDDELSVPALCFYLRNDLPSDEDKVRMVVRQCVPDFHPLALAVTWGKIAWKRPSFAVNELRHYLQDSDINSDLANLSFAVLAVEDLLSETDVVMLQSIPPWPRFYCLVAQIARYLPLRVLSSTTARLLRQVYPESSMRELFLQFPWPDPNSLLSMELFYELRGLPFEQILEYLDKLSDSSVSVLPVLTILETLSLPSIVYIRTLRIGEELMNLLALRGHPIVGQLLVHNEYALRLALAHPAAYVQDRAAYADIFASDDFFAALKNICHSYGDFAGVAPLAFAIWTQSSGELRVQFLREIKSRLPKDFSLLNLILSDTFSWGNNVGMVQSYIANVLSGLLDASHFQFARVSASRYFSMVPLLFADFDMSIPPSESDLAARLRAILNTERIVSAIEGSFSPLGWRILDLSETPLSRDVKFEVLIPIAERLLEPPPKLRMVPHLQAIFELILQVRPRKAHLVARLFHCLQRCIQRYPVLLAVVEAHLPEFSSMSPELFWRKSENLVEFKAGLKYVEEAEFEAGQMYEEDEVDTPSGSIP
eukprot:TRINITY_DN1657_c0_g1_i4.p1 TRINITY_DN1657_c0_g1~~TRINITY_DN1657_c0_g1_i4.p1  ORF type:complete len:638 (+),score=52.36 TRINITY_DN1657_c0_g1_i4:1824-3737(+)